MSAFQNHTHSTPTFWNLLSSENIGGAIGGGRPFIPFQPQPKKEALRHYRPVVPSFPSSFRLCLQQLPSSSALISHPGCPQVCPQPSFQKWLTPVSALKPIVTALFQPSQLIAMPPCRKNTAPHTMVLASFMPPPVVGAVPLPHQYGLPLLFTFTRREAGTGLVSPCPCHRAAD